MPAPEKIKSAAQAIAEHNNKTRIRTIEGFAQLPPDEQQRRLQKPETLYAWAEKILTAIEQKDVLTLQDTIGTTMNRASQKVFEAETDLRMGTNQSQRNNAIRIWCGTEAYETAIARRKAEREREAARREQDAETRSINLMLAEQVRHNGTVKTRKEMFDDLFQEGYDRVEYLKKGCTMTLRLWKENSFYTFRRKEEFRHIERHFISQPQPQQIAA